MIVFLSPHPISFTKRIEVYICNCVLSFVAFYSQSTFKYSYGKDKILIDAYMCYSNEVQKNSTSWKICRVIILWFIERMVAIVTIHFYHHFPVLSIFNNIKPSHSQDNGDIHTNCP
jgi:hypothetical protein